MAVRRGERQRVAGIDRAERAARHHHRRLQQLGEQQQVGPGIDRAATGEDEGISGLAQQFRRRRDAVGVGLGRVVGVRRVDGGDVALGLQDVHRHLDMDRAAAAGMELAERLGQGGGRVAR